MDVNALKDMVNRVNPGRKENPHKNLWFKPTDKPTSIRILPYPHADNNIPFLDVYYHYDVGGVKSIVCPKHHDGSPCPICDLADEFRGMSRGGGKDDPNWKIFLALKAKARIYAPILVRGQEDEGVKLWGFPQTILTYFIEKASDPDWGDFTDPKNGRDVTVQVLMPNSANNPSSFKRPVASLKPGQSPILSTPAETKELLDNIPNFYEMDPSPFEIMSHAELVSLVKKIGAEDSDTEIDSDDLPSFNNDTPGVKASASDDLKTKLDNLLD